MAQSSDHRLLLLGAFAGAAGVSLAVVLLQTRRRPTLFPSSDDERAAGAAEAADRAGRQVGQAEVLGRLGDLTRCVSELKDELRALRDALPTLRDHVRDELRGPAGGAAVVAGRRDSPLRGRSTPSRRRRAPASASRAGGLSSEEAESEGGYMTAFTDSEEDEQSEGGQSGEEEVPTNELSVLLERMDALHKGTDADKRESLVTLLEKREEFGQSSAFLWRLIRAYTDLHDISSSIEEKKTSAQTGKKVGEEAVVLDPSCAEIHQWYAIMCGIMAEYETVQNRIKNGYIFKDHLDKAIELKPQDPMSYYLLGRWCYAVAQLSWIERKVAATLFGEPPTASVQDALNYFLKDLLLLAVRKHSTEAVSSFNKHTVPVEEISPKYSKNNYVFLAKCYKDLSQKGKARKMCEAACSMETTSKEDEEAQRELDSLLPSL